MRIGAFVAACGLASASAILVACTEPRECRSGCEKWLTMSRKDIEQQKIPDDAKRALLGTVDRAHATDLAHCESRCREGNVDGPCLARIARVEDSASCISH